MIYRGFNNKGMKKFFKKNYIKVIIIIVIIGIISAIKISGIDKYLSFENLNKYKIILKNFVAANYFFSVMIYIIIYILVAGLSIPGATILTLAGGFLFGAILTTLYVNAGATAGATLSFFISRFIFGKSLQEKYALQFKDFNEELEKNGKYYLLTLRFIPLVPFFLINILAGLTKINPVIFIVTTSIGILPGSFVYAFAGSNLYNVNSPKDILSIPIIIALLLLGLFSIIPVIIKKIIDKKTKPA